MAPFVAGCSSSPPTATDGVRDSLVQDTDSISIVPQKAFLTSGEATRVSIAAKPNANCTLQGSDESNFGQPVFADNEGVVELELSTEHEPGEVERLSLSCTDEDGAPFRRQVNLEVTNTPVAQPPLDRNALAVPPPLRPGLVDSTSLTDADVVKLGYPHRPDRRLRPDRYERWQARVARPTRFVNAREISMPGRVNTTYSNSQIWDGPVVTGSGGWLNVESEWDVPSVLAPLSDCSVMPSAEVSTWVGLGGFGTSSLVQAGTNGTWGCYVTSQGTYVRTASYYSWLEVLPANVTGLTLPAHAGDHFYVDVWLGDTNGNENITGGYAWFYLSNDTLQTSTTKKVAISAAYGSQASNSAEWIVERPTINGSPTSLARFGFTSVLFAFADTATTWTVPNDPGANFRRMYNGTKQLADTGPWDGCEFGCGVDTWDAFYLWKAYYF